MLFSLFSFFQKQKQDPDVLWKVHTTLHVYVSHFFVLSLHVHR